MDRVRTHTTGGEREFNGYIFEPQPDGSLEIHLSADAGRTLVTTLPSDLIVALTWYLTSAARER